MLTLSHKQMCPVERIVAVGVSFLVAIFGLLFALFTFYWRFQIEVKVWLYAHRYCMRFVREEKYDRTKMYDAFISYSHEDEDFVIDQLVPGLENGPNRFKISLGFKSWIISEYILTQISRFVEESRRTIVVLSPNFLKGVWSRMEFRAAHKQVFSDERVKVVVVLFGDIPPAEKLDPVLRAYLSINAHVKWGDPWFWDKLNYALRHSMKYCKGFPVQ